MYATLAIRLARPVRVVEVVVEHPPVEIMEERGTALKEFWVIGFEDLMRMVERYHLYHPSSLPSIVPGVLTLHVSTASVCMEIKRGRRAVQFKWGFLLMSLHHWVS